MKALRELKGKELATINGGNGIGRLFVGRDQSFSGHPVVPVVKRDPIVDKLFIRDRVLGI